MLLSKENTSSRSQVVKIFSTSRDSHDESESGSDREEGEDEENIQEAFNQQYIERMEFAKTAKEF